MLTDEQLNNLPPKAKAFWTMAQNFLRDNKAEWVWIERNSKEHAAWASYFRSQGWKPFALRQMEKGIELGGVNKMTMPAQFPQWFDKNYHPLPGSDFLTREPIPAAPTAESKANIEAMRLEVHDVFAKIMKRRGTDTWIGPTSEELRSRYAPRDAAE